MKTFNKKFPYEDILYLPHPEPDSKKHPRMDPIQRAAQFSPFSALTGYEDAVKETARETEGFRELDDNQKVILDWKLQQFQKELENQPWMTVWYYVADDQKEGGSYQEYTGRLKRIRKYEQKLIFADHTEIPIKDILEIR